MHIVIGDGGNREGLADTYDEPQPEWSAYREASFGSGTLDLLNITHALWRWHRNQDTQAVVSDEVGGGASLSEPAPLEGVACSLVPGRRHRKCSKSRPDPRERSKYLGASQAGCLLCRSGWCATPAAKQMGQHSLGCGRVSGLWPRRHCGRVARL